jgi:ParB family chromosome partitioning protein
MSRRTQRPSPILSTSTALIGEASDSLVTRGSRFRHSFEAPVDRIEPHPGQARTQFDQREIEALAATMTEQGQLQPILLSRNPSTKGHWLIVAGERRWRAARHNGWTTILAIEHEGDVEVASLIENLQRVDLTPVEEARGLRRLIGEKGYSQTAAAAPLGKSKAEVSATLRILTLPDEVLDAVLTSELRLAKNALIELARVEDSAARARLIELAHRDGLTVRAIRDAQEQAERPGTGRETAKDRVGPKRNTLADTIIPMKLVKRLNQSLLDARTTGRAPDAAERERLLHLRNEIDRLLMEEGAP